MSACGREMSVDRAYISQGAHHVKPRAREEQAVVRIRTRDVVALVIALRPGCGRRHSYQDYRIYIYIVLELR